MIDTAGKLCHILRSHHAVLHDLRITGNGHQRCFKFMGHIRRKLPSQFSSVLQFFHLIPDLPILLIHPHKKRAEFLIFHFFQWLLQIKLIDGLDQSLHLKIHKKY